MKLVQQWIDLLLRHVQSHAEHILAANPRSMLLGTSVCMQILTLNACAIPERDFVLLMHPSDVSIGSHDNEQIQYRPQPQIIT